MKILQSAVVKAVQESMGFTLQKADSALKRSFASQIRLGDKTFIIVVNKAFLQKFAFDFLGEENPSLEVLNDITKEVSNLIVGKAKVLYEENGEILKLGTPEFLGSKMISKFSAAAHYRFQKNRCSIYQI